MRYRSLLIAVLVLLLVAAALFFAASKFNLSALNEPSRLETYAATKAKRWLVARRAREPLPAEPPKSTASVNTGGMIFRGECAACHGLDGRKPTDIGRWMYPRVLDLGSPDVQQWSDAELFWIIKNGVRMTGMPGFGKLHSDEQIWHLVHYVRSLGAQAQP